MRGDFLSSRKVSQHPDSFNFIQERIQKTVFNHENGLKLVERCMCSSFRR